MRTPRSIARTEPSAADARRLAVPPRNRASTRPTSVHPTCRPARCSTASSGTFACRAMATPALLAEVRSDLRLLLERRQSSSRTTRSETAIVSTMRLAAAAGRRRGDRVTHLAVRSRGPPLPVPAGDAGRDRRRASRPRSPSQSRRRCHRHGKTVIAALDYRRLCEPTAQPPTSSVRGAPTRDPGAVAAHLSRGAGGRRLRRAVRRRRPPERWEHVFASVQSLTPTASRTSVRRLRHRRDRRVPPRGGPTYRRILDHLEPHELLGLTATPERADGVDVRALLRRSDGRRAAAVGRAGRRPAVPVPLLRRRRRNRPARHWPGPEAATTRRSSSNVYTGNDARARIVLAATPRQGLRRLVPCGPSASASASRTPSTWPRYSTKPGIPRRAVSGRLLSAEREQALTGPAAPGGVNVLFAADLFNEGLDMPDVDTVLFLRPTESATVFLQQLGRGLRRTATRPC